jgi:hypothetical protein
MSCDAKKVRMTMTLLPQTVVDILCGAEVLGCQLNVYFQAS